MHLPVRPVEDVVNACVLSQLQESKFRAFCTWAIHSRGGAPKSHHQDVQDLVSANTSEEDVRMSHFNRNSTLNGTFSETLIPGVYKPLQPLSSVTERHPTIECGFHNPAQVERPTRLCKQTRRSPGESTGNVDLAAVQRIRSIQGGNLGVASNDDCFRRVQREDRRS